MMLDDSVRDWPMMVAMMVDESLTDWPNFSADVWPRSRGAFRKVNAMMRVMIMPGFAAR